MDTLRAAITRTGTHEQYPWDWTVDFCYPGTTIRNTDIDSFDYGTVATFEEAVASVCWVMNNLEVSRPDLIDLLT